jgi:hypothetical protein
MVKKVLGSLGAIVGDAQERGFSKLRIEADPL